MRSRILHGLAAAFAFALLSSIAHAQGFQVRPMAVEAQVPQGRTVLIPLEIGSTSGLDDAILDIEVAHLTQRPAGSLTFLPLDDPDFDRQFSAADWLDVPDTVSLPTLSKVRLDVLMEVPRATRGTYTAALLVSSRPAEGSGLRLAVRFLIPIIVTIEGLPTRQNVRLTDANLVRVIGSAVEETGEIAPEDVVTPTTLLQAEISNRGRSFSRFNGRFWLDYRDDAGEWHQIRFVEVEERRILPGLTLTIPLDLERRLPTATYQVRGELYVDGRRTVPLREEIAFEGDPEIRDVAYDLNFELEPDFFNFEYRPGAVRTGRMTVENPGLDPVDFTIGFALPDGMGGRASAEERGDDLSAVPWLEVAPARFTLRPGGRQSVRLMGRFPDENAAYDNFYADVILRARYQDGQSAGEFRSLVEVSSADGEDDPAAVIEAVRFSETDQSGMYSVNVRMTNTGDVLLEPDVSYEILSANGDIIDTSAIGRDQRPLLPFVSRSFGGLLDLSRLAPGEYLIRTTVRSGPDYEATRLTRLRTGEDGVFFETARND